MYVMVQRSSYMKETMATRLNCAHNFANGEVKKKVRELR